MGFFACLIGLFCCVVGLVGLCCFVLKFGTLCNPSPTSCAFGYETNLEPFR